MKKKLLSLVLSLAMLCALVTSISAATYTDGTWKVTHSISTTYGEVTQSSCTSTIYASTAKSGATSTASSYVSQTDSSGNNAYVYVTAVYQDTSGNTYTVFSGSHKSASSTLSGTRSIAKGGTVIASYTAKGATSVSYNITGTLKFK
jgi:hypothetical protein